MDKNYIAGFMENIGCFNIRYYKNRRGRKKYPLFKVIISKNLTNKLEVMDRINKYFKDNYGFYFKTYESDTSIIYQIQSDDMTLSLIRFLEENLISTKPKQKEVKDVVVKYIEKRKQREKLKKTSQTKNVN